MGVFRRCAAETEGLLGRGCQQLSCHSRFTGKKRICDIRRVVWAGSRYRNWIDCLDRRQPSVFDSSSFHELAELRRRRSAPW